MAANIKLICALAMIVAVCFMASFSPKNATSIEDCCRQVYVNNERLAQLERRVNDLEDWKSDHVSHATQNGMERIAVLERTVEVHDWIFRSFGILFAAVLIGTMWKRLVKRGAGQ